MFPTSPLRNETLGISALTVHKGPSYSVPWPWVEGQRGQILLVAEEDMRKGPAWHPVLSPKASVPSASELPGAQDC